jgi:hypothetical protein
LARQIPGFHLAIPLFTIIGFLFNIWFLFDIWLLFATSPTFPTPDPSSPNTCPSSHNNSTVQKSGGVYTLCENGV